LCNFVRLFSLRLLGLVGEGRGNNQIKRQFCLL
jgi:hypothetical protein